MPITLKAARTNVELTQVEVVNRLEELGIKISKNTLTSYEKYRTKPDIETAKALAKIYRRSVDDIKFF